MPILLLIAAALFIWAYMTGRIRRHQIAPLLLSLAGAGLLLRGQFIPAIIAIAVAIPWYRGAILRAIPGPTAENIRWAREMLDLDEDVTVEQVRARHRRLIAENHPDLGGNPDRARDLNRAKDILISKIGKISE